MDIKAKRKNKMRRHKRVRALVKGTSDLPRFSVFRSGRHIYAQLIDDSKGATLLSATDADEKKGKADKSSKKTSAFKVGEALAKEALDKGIKKAVFDRGGYKYHGRVKAVAEGARQGGIKF